MLAVSPHDDDHRFLQRAFRHPDWNVHSCAGKAEARRIMGAKNVRVVVCERDLPDGCWRDLWEALEELPSPPLFIVASRHADEQLWAEVLNLGAYDVLAKPFEMSEVVRVVGMAFRQWRGPSQHLSGDAAAHAAA